MMFSNANNAESVSTSILLLKYDASSNSKCAWRKNKNNCRKSFCTKLPQSSRLKGNTLKNKFVVYFVQTTPKELFSHAHRLKMIILTKSAKKIFVSVSLHPEKQLFWKIQKGYFVKKQLFYRWFFMKKQLFYRLFGWKPVMKNSLFHFFQTGFSGAQYKTCFIRH